MSGWGRGGGGGVLQRTAVEGPRDKHRRTALEGRDKRGETHLGQRHKGQ